MKKRLIILSICILCTIFIAGSIAFLTRQIQIDNIITFGSIEMKLIETTLNENNEEIPVENGSFLNISNMPNISRIVKVQNPGKQPIYVRVSLKIVGIDGNGNEFNVEQFVTYDANNVDWIYKDGWYYYKKELNSNETTENLITQIHFDLDRILMNYSNPKFELKINAKAVQFKNNADNVLDAKGWPKD